jgi:hypothetical protein
MGGNETVKFLETLEDNVFRQNYYMVVVTQKTMYHILSLNAQT